MNREEMKTKAKKWYEKHETEIKFLAGYGTGIAVIIGGCCLFDKCFLKKNIETEVLKLDNGDTGIRLIRESIFRKRYDVGNVVWADPESPKKVAKCLLEAAEHTCEELKKFSDWEDRTT